MRWTKTLVGYLLLAPIAVLASCRMATGLEFPGDADPMVPLAVYRDWWSTVEACSGLHGRFDAIHWYSIGIFWINGQLAAGAWFESGNRIVIASPCLLDGGAVRHEMLHALLQRGDHPREYFVTRCGDVVSCGSQCSTAQASPDMSANDGLLEPDVPGIATRIEPGRR